MLKIGLIKEGKNPPDKRVAFTPKQIKNVIKKYPQIKFVVQPSEVRCYKDQEYLNERIEMSDQLDDCDILMGIKEVPIDQIIGGKSYLFFSHTIKKQAYNRKLLQAIVEKKVRMIDYETLVDENEVRLIGFGRFAGIVGAHYAIMMWGRKNKLFNLNQAREYHDLKELFALYKPLEMGNPRVLVTGKGRVGHGIAELLMAADFTQVNTEEYVNQNNTKPVFVQIDADEIYKHNEGKVFDFHYFTHHLDEYSCNFDRFLPCTDILINGIFWDTRAPRLFSKEQVQTNNFKIKIISDVSCDINGSVPLTTRATNSNQPFYGINPQTLEECEPFTPSSIDMMTIDNLPNELPRDSSEMFGNVLSERIIHLLLHDHENPIINRAVIAENGKLTSHFSYLQDYLDEKE
jgi:alanine dehydrogenase